MPSVECTNHSKPGVYAHDNELQLPIDFYEFDTQGNWKYERSAFIFNIIDNNLLTSAQFLEILKNLAIICREDKERSSNWTYYKKYFISKLNASHLQELAYFLCLQAPHFIHLEFEGSGFHSQRRGDDECSGEENLYYKVHSKDDAMVLSMARLEGYLTALGHDSSTFKEVVESDWCYEYICKDGPGNAATLIYRSGIESLIIEMFHFGITDLQFLETYFKKLREGIPEACKFFAKRCPHPLPTNVREYLDSCKKAKASTIKKMTESICDLAAPLFERAGKKHRSLKKVAKHPKTSAQPEADPTAVDKLKMELERYAKLNAELMQTIAEQARQIEYLQTATASSPEKPAFNVVEKSQKEKKRLEMTADQCRKYFFALPCMSVPAPGIGEPFQVSMQRKNQPNDIKKLLKDAKRAYENFEAARKELQIAKVEFAQFIQTSQKRVSHVVHSPSKIPPPPPPSGKNPAFAIRHVELSEKAKVFAKIFHLQDDLKKMTGALIQCIFPPSKKSEDTLPPVTELTEAEIIIAYEELTKVLNNKLEELESNSQLPLEAPKSPVRKLTAEDKFLSPVKSYENLLKSKERTQREAARAEISVSNITRDINEFLEQPLSLEEFLENKALQSLFETRETRQKEKAEIEKKIYQGNELAAAKLTTLQKLTRSQSTCFEELKKLAQEEARKVESPPSKDKALMHGESPASLRVNRRLSMQTEISAEKMESWKEEYFSRQVEILQLRFKKVFHLTVAPKELPPEYSDEILQTKIDRLALQLQEADSPDLHREYNQALNEKELVRLYRSAMSYVYASKPEDRLDFIKAFNEGAESYVLEKRAQLIK